MDFEAAAIALIEAVEGIISDENIEGVVGVMTKIVDGCNINWEYWITDETNAALAVDKVSCDCGKQIIVERTYDAVYADVV